MQKKIPLVIGLGITGRSLVNYLASLHEEIIIIEDSIDNSVLNDIEHPNLKLDINPAINDDLLAKVSTIYTSPGIPNDHEIFSYASRAVSYTHLRAHETLRYLVCRLLLEKKNIVTEW